jgi:uncharacterized membrane protein YhdT
LHRLTLAQGEALRVGSLTYFDKALNLFLARGLASDPGLEGFSSWRDMTCFLNRQWIIAGRRWIIGRRGKLFAMMD